MEPKNIALLALTFMLFLAFPQTSQAQVRKVTEYYTMVGSRPTGCAMEGNKIVNGQLFYSDNSGRCTPLKKYCPYGVGSRNNCIVPCVHGAGSTSYFRRGQVVSVPTFTCPWGPHKGKRISKIIVDDVGSWVNGSHVDVFKGLCKRTSGGVCREWAEPTQIAQYGSGRNMNSQLAALKSQHPAGVARPGTEVASAPVAPARTASIITTSSRSTYVPRTVSRPAARPAARPARRVEYQPPAFNAVRFFEEMALGSR